jgi:hypothetical protein
MKVKLFKKGIRYLKIYPCSLEASFQQATANLAKNRARLNQANQGKAIALIVQARGTKAKDLPIASNGDVL